MYNRKALEAALYLRVRIRTWEYEFFPVDKPICNSTAITDAHGADRSQALTQKQTFRICSLFRLSNG